jgi:hypothetical protein
LKLGGGAALRYKVNRVWLPADDELMKKYVAEGISPFRIAAKLKRSESSIRRRAVVLDVKLPSVSEIRAKNRLPRSGTWPAVNRS